MKYIYGLVDPRTRQIRYIGQTDDLAKRLQQHITDKSNTPKTEWIRGLQMAQLLPDIIQLAIVSDGENAHNAEYRWIYFARKNGWELTNTTGMKSEDYYSLQGYFERLIIEMEKPEDVVAKPYTMDDAKQEVIALLVKSLKSLSAIPSFARSVGTAIVFCLFTWVLCAGAAAWGSGETVIGVIGVIASIGGAFGTFLAILGWLTTMDDNSNKNVRAIRNVFLLLGLIQLCVATLVKFFA